MAGTKVRPCTCPHEYQDRKYGKFMRLHNVSKDGKKFRCTVCGTQKLT